MAGWPTLRVNLSQKWVPHRTRFSLGGEHEPGLVLIHHMVPAQRCTNRDTMWTGGPSFRTHCTSNQKHEGAPSFAVFEGWRRFGVTHTPDFFLSEGNLRRLRREERFYALEEAAALTQREH